MSSKKIYLFSLILIVLVILFTGCQSQSDPIADPLQDIDTPVGALPPDIPALENEDPDPDLEVAPGKGNAHISSPSDGETSIDEEDTTEVVEERDSESTDSQEQESSFEREVTYNPTNPTLLGFTIHQSKDEFTAKFGSPRDEFLMPDDRDPITVYLYEGFSVGFNHRNQIAFIDVHTSAVDPGLNGFRLGQSTDDAIKALGKPDTNTEFVLNYKSDKVILKMDVDPNANQVISIKLFAG